MAASNSVTHRIPDPTDFVPGNAESDAGARLATMSLTMQLYGLGFFVRTLGAQLRYGHLSRAPLKLLRFELRGDSAACDWVARPADPWDAYLPLPAGDRNASEQALEDAIALRGLLFNALPNVNTAAVRVYRDSPGRQPELIIEGTVARDQSAARTIRSLPMRAKLCGLQFCLEDGILEELQAEECAMSL
jgi:hypothetical protein